MADKKLTDLAAATSLAFTDIVLVTKSPGGAAASNKATLAILSNGMSVVARYSTAAGQSIPNNSDTVINFDVQNYDTHSAVTTGAAWRFTAPVDGYYLVTISMLFAATDTWIDQEYVSLISYINSVGISRMGFTAHHGSASSIFVGASGTDILQLNAGDTLNIHVIQTSGAALALHNAADYNYIAITKT
jgi:hypothetical protein